MYNFWWSFRCSMCGYFPGKEGHSDYGIAFVLGWIELVAYPIFMALNAWSVIGAWLAFKSLAQWSGWKDARHAYNRYLLGNACIVGLAAIVLTNFIITGEPLAGTRGHIFCQLASEIPASENLAQQF